LKNVKMRSLLIGALSIVLAASLASPAKAAKNGTVFLYETNPLSGFNSAVVGYNLVTNSTIG